MHRLHTLIIPGIDGSPEGHLQAWWADTDPNATLVEQDDWRAPVPEAWEARLASAIRRRPGSILVAHSLGCLLVARLLRRWKHAPVRAALLVAPADPALNARIGMFEIEAQDALGVPAMVVCSRNDPWMGFEKATSIAAAWGAEFVDMDQSGHINIASGHGPWPEGRELHATLVRRAQNQSPAVPSEIRTSGSGASF
jgi:predicted alpha/beta hydrolase family esterase